MNSFEKKSNNDFAQITLLIEEARNRAFQKVNEELVLLYFKVGGMVSEKVSNGIWGSGTVDELARYITSRLPELTGFNKRGLYRMKQFYESYSVEEFVSPMATLLEKTFDGMSAIVSALPTQLSYLKIFPQCKKIYQQTFLKIHTSLNFSTCPMSILKKT